MRFPNIRDRSLLVLIACLLLLLLGIGLVWMHYDAELLRLKQQQNDIKLYKD